MKSFLYRLLFIFFIFSRSVFASPIDKIVLFGDSLSDTGNIYQLTIEAHKAIPAIPIIPKNPPYFNGRFSNGPVWIDTLSQAMNVPLINYAYGGAWVEPLSDSRQIFPFGLDTQIDMYLVANIFDLHKKDHLYVIWGGANDYIDDRSDAEYATTNTVHHLENQIDSLIFAGAKKFLVLNLPDFAYLPIVMAKGPDYAARISHLSQLHNQKLQNMLNYETKNHPDVLFINADVSAPFDDMISHPEKYHLKNIANACYTGGYSLSSLKFDNEEELTAAKKANIDIAHSTVLHLAYQNALAAQRNQQLICDRPDEYFYWDQLHPTTVIHQLIATMALEKISNHAG
jgi:phospholipase/lecithinase/hemolysin